MTKYIIALRFFICTTVVMAYYPMATAQCTMSDLTIEPSACNADDQFSVSIFFVVNGGSDAGFAVIGNGTNYGNFSYGDLPISIPSLDGNCVTEYEFIIRDLVDPSCAIFDGIGTVCCTTECSIILDDAEVSVCDADDNFDLTLTYGTMGLAGSDQLIISINGSVIDTVSAETTQTTLSDLSTTNLGTNTISICSVEDPTCCGNGTFLNPCQCTIANVTAEIIDCDEPMMVYYAVIDFDHVATSDSFQMGYSDAGDNNFLGVFAYADLPVTAGPINMSANEREILIVDKGDLFCFSSAFLGVVDDCDIGCQIFNLFAESTECEDGQYFIDLEFDTEDIEGSTFDVLVDDVYYGTFVYGSNSYSVGPIPENCFSPPVVRVVDSAIEGCADFFNFDDAICCDGDCSFSLFEADSQCNDAQEVIITASYANGSVLPGTSFFITIQDSMYGPYAPPADNVEINMGVVPDGVYMLSISPDTEPTCTATTSVEVNCTVDCVIESVIAEAYECEDGTAFADIAFDFAETSDSFQIVGNGAVYGIFPYGEDFYTVGPLVGDCETLYEFIIVDLGIEGCQAEGGLSEPICCEACSIRDLFLVDYVCEGEGVAAITIDFVFEETTSDSFDLAVDGLLIGTYGYNTLPIQIDGPFSTLFTVTVSDSEDVSCATTASFDVECGPAEDCLIDEGVLTFVSCEDDIYTLSLDFLYENVSDSFLIDVIGLSTSYAYADLPILIDNLPVAEEVIVLITDSADESCSISRSFLLEVCETSVTDPLLSDVGISTHGLQTIISNPHSALLPYQVISSTGAILQKGIAKGLGETIVDHSNLHTGMYYISIAIATDRLTKKIVIIH